MISLHNVSAHKWGVILAGGEGERLRSLTRFVAGDDRPKQFCPLLEGGETLLTRTRSRVSRIVSADRTLLALTRTHEEFYSQEVAEIPVERLIIQPSNRGTLPAILSSLARIARVDPEAVVAFFPSDHYYSRETEFVEAANAAYDHAAAHGDRLILLGAEARRAESGYGYIEPRMRMQKVANGTLPLSTVARFWEKPTPSLAQRLVNAGCLWNTFVMAGRVATSLSTIEAAMPALYYAFEPMLSSEAGENHREALESVYHQIPAGDFSKLVLARATQTLAVLNIGEVGWSDLGEPHRVVDALSTDGSSSPWLTPWKLQNAMAATGAGN